MAATRFGAAIISLHALRPREIVERHSTVSCAGCPELSRKLIMAGLLHHLERSGSLLLLVKVGPAAQPATIGIKPR
jgi:hypothetical protein